MAEWVDLQNFGVHLGVWLLILGATEASVPQDFVCAMSMRPKDDVGEQIQSWINGVA